MQWKKKTVNRMDKSQTYIDMCREATEIQEQWNPIVGDCVYIHEPRQLPGRIVNGMQEIKEVPINPYTSIIKSISEHGDFSTPVSAWWKPNKNTWLLRQDQLQEMLDDPISDYWHYSNHPNYKRHCGLICDINNFASRIDTIYADSMEQLWLAFVMKEKYNKKWNGETWELI